MEASARLILLFSRHRVAWVSGALALAAIGGVAYFLGFPGFDYYPFAFVALVPLVVALERERERRFAVRALVAFVYGVVEFAGGYWWMRTFLGTFSGFPWIVTVLITVIFCSYLALFTVLFAWAYGRARERGYAPTAITVAATVALESTFPMIFPSYLGNSLHPLPIAIQIAQRTFLVGERCSIADISLYAYTHVADQAGIDLAPYASVRAWLQRIASLPGYVPITHVVG